MNMSLRRRSVVAPSVILTFCPVPLLAKRPRAHPFSHRLHPSTPRIPSLAPCPSITRCVLDASDPSLAHKVETTLLATEQASDLSTGESRLPPRALPVALDLLNYHARVASRRPPSRDVADRLYRRCIDLNPADGRAWLGLARLRASVGNTDGARRTFRSAVSAAPGNPFILQAWGVFEERLRNLERAKNLYLAALRADPLHAPAWVALGLWHQRHANDISSARIAFRRGAQADPSNYYVWHVWGVLEKNCRRFPRARDCFRKGVSANPYNGATYVLWGSLEDEAGNNDIAMNLFEKAHTVNPRNMHAYLSHAVAAEKAGDLAKARKLLKRAIAIRPSDAAPRQLLGLLQFRQGDLSAARGTFEKALEKDPKHAPTWHAWARVECASGHHDRARKLFQEAVWVAPRALHVVRTWHSWAMMEMNLGRNEAARRFFAHGLDVNNRSVVLLTGVAELEAKEGNMSRAREYMERCVRLEPWRLSMWRLYQRLENNFGSAHRAQLVYERSVVIGQQVEERYKLSDPLPGDFQGSGMWIDALELPPDKSAFDSIGAGTTSVTSKSGVRGRTVRKRQSGVVQRKTSSRKRESPKPMADEETDIASTNQGSGSSDMMTAFGF